MDLRDYLDILRARWRLIVATTLLGVLAAGVASLLTTPMYRATSSVFVSTADATGDVGQAYTGSLFTQQRVKSYVDVVTSTPVSQAVVDDLGLAMTPQQLASKISVDNPLDTVVLEISATDPSPALAQQIANSATDQFAAQVTQMESPTQGGSSLVKISTIQRAVLPTAPYSPRTLVNLALGFLVGLAVGVGAAVLLETLDTRIKTVEALQKYFDVPLLGVIPLDPDAEKKPLIVQEQPHATRAESFRHLRTNLQFVDVDHRPRSIVVTSSLPREGKTTTAINLALTLAQTGQPVFLVEADLRRPKVADYLGVEGAAGLTDVLVGRATVDDVLQPWGTTGNLWVLASGPLPPNPSELLGSQAMADLLRHLETRATLIIDAPPLLPVTDAAVVTRLAGGAIVVLAANKTRREHLRTAASSIDSVGGRILGLVMNMASAKGSDAQRYGYAYGNEYGSNISKGQLADHPAVVPAGLSSPGPNGSGSAKGKVDLAQPQPAPAPAAPKPAPAEAKPARAHADEKPVPAPAEAQPGRVQADAKPARAEAKQAPAPAESKPVVAEVSRAELPGRRSTQTLTERLAVSASQRVAENPPLARSTPEPPPAPAPAARPEPAVSPFDADTVVPGEPWQPPRPRPAFDPLTAPIDEVSGDAV